jgi:hypothetical protein
MINQNRIPKAAAPSAWQGFAMVCPALPHLSSLRRVLPG